MLLNWVTRSFCCFALVGLVTSSAWSATPVIPATSATAAHEEQVELFAAMESGDIQVTLVARSSRQATIVVENKTKKPLSVKMPAAFAGVPALAQFGGQGGGGFGGGGLGGGGLGGGQQQGIGGGLGGGGLGGGGGFGGGGGQQGGGGFFNVAPEKAAKVKVGCVCLEHGKKEPNASVKYKLVPIESVTSSREVIELCTMMGTGEITDQASAQVAAWHLANGMSFEQLAAKTVRHANGQITSFFEQAQLVAGVKIAQVAHAKAEKSKEPKETGKADSLSTK
jgi:hypothetical protein